MTYNIRLNDIHKLLDVFIYVLFCHYQIIGVGELLHLLQKIMIFTNLLLKIRVKLRWWSLNVVWCKLKLLPVDCICSLCLQTVEYLSNTPIQNHPQNQLKMISIWLTSIEGMFGELYRTRRESLCKKY